MEYIGAACFGFVIGWVTYRTLRRKADAAALGDIASVIGAVGGATVVGLFRNGAFDGYCVGLLAGFLAYFLSGVAIDRAAKDGKIDSKTGATSWMTDRNAQ